MATQDVRLYSTGLDGANDVRLYQVARNDDAPRNDVWLYSTGQDGANDVRLYPYEYVAGGAPFPTQYAGLRIWHSGAMMELCLVATADAPAGMGGQLRIRKGGATYAIYLVETSDPNASPLPLRTSAGTKSVRLKT